MSHKTRPAVEHARTLQPALSRRRWFDWNWFCGNQYRIWIRLRYEFGSSPRGVGIIFRSRVSSTPQWPHPVRFWVIRHRHKEDESTRSEEILRDERSEDTDVRREGGGGKRGRLEILGAAVEMYNGRQTPRPSLNHVCHTRRGKERRCGPVGALPRDCLIFLTSLYLVSFFFLLMLTAFRYFF